MTLPQNLAWMMKMKIKRNNPFPDETGNAVPVGEPGAGKSAFSSGLIFARSDDSRLQRVDGAMNQDELVRDANSVAEAVFRNSNWKLILKK